MVFQVFQVQFLHIASVSNIHVQRDTNYQIGFLITTINGTLFRLGNNTKKRSILRDDKGARDKQDVEIDNTKTYDP